MIKGIIFDVDGTTLDTILDLKDSVNKTLKQLGHKEATYDEVRQGLGMGFEMLIKSSAPDLTEEEQSIARDIFREDYAKNYDVKTRPFEGVRETIEELYKKGIKLAINSNKRHEQTEQLVKINFPGINFVAIYGKSDKWPCKPDPQMPNKIVEMMGLNKEEVLYVGDSEVDVKTAHNTGLKCVGCLWGYRDLETFNKAGCDYVISKPEELIKLI